MEVEVERVKRFGWGWAFERVVRGVDDLRRRCCEERVVVLVVLGAKKAG